MAASADLQAALEASQAETVSVRAKLQAAVRQQQCYISLLRHPPSPISPPEGCIANSRGLTDMLCPRSGAQGEGIAAALGHSGGSAGPTSGHAAPARGRQ
jgi:hypothetical protein